MCNNKMNIRRKIDSMGRIVIPKEYRDKYNIKDNDYLQLIPSNKGFLIKKYSILSNYKSILQYITDIINSNLSCEVFISQKDYILAYSGKYKNNFLGKNVSDNIINSIERRECLFEKYNKKIEICNNSFIYGTYINDTIISNSEELGIIFIIREDNCVTDADFNVIKIVTSFLNKYLED